MHHAQMVFLLFFASMRPLNYVNFKLYKTMPAANKKGPVLNRALKQKTIFCSYAKNDLVHIFLIIRIDFLSRSRSQPKVFLCGRAPGRRLPFLQPILADR